MSADHTAGETCAAAAVFRRIGIIVAAGMNHQRSAAQLFGIGDPRRGQRSFDASVSVGVDARQIAEMAIAVRPCVPRRGGRIPVTTGCARWRWRAVIGMRWRWKPCSPGGKPVRLSANTAPCAELLIVTVPIDAPGPASSLSASGTLMFALVGAMSVLGVGASAGGEQAASAKSAVARSNCFTGSSMCGGDSPEVCESQE